MVNGPALIFRLAEPLLSVEPLLSSAHLTHSYALVSTHLHPPDWRSCSLEPMNLLGICNLSRLRERSDAVAAGRGSSPKPRKMRPSPGPESPTSPTKTWAR